jgi:hypothetical protein
MLDFYIEPNGLFGQNLPWKIHCKSSGKGLFFERSIPSGSLILDKHQIDTLSQLYGHVGFEDFPEEKHKIAFETVFRNHPRALTEDIPWEQCFTTKRYYNMITEKVTTWRDKLGNVDLEYYLNHFRPEQKIFDYLQPVKVSPLKYWNNLKEATGGQKECVQSFMPTSGYAQPVKYSHTDTLTGRLKVLSGPNILLLQKKYRNMIESRFGSDGRIVYLDYASLEPRVLLSVTNPSLIGYLPLDIYSKVIDDLGLTGIDRNLVKLVILSQIYGAGEDLLLSKLAGHVSEPLVFIQKIKDYFGVEGLQEKLVSEFAINARSHVRNFYGRYVICPAARRYVLLNYYVQSTAVDVALKGFNQIVQKIESAKLLTKIVPTLILHDGLILDVHNEVCEASLPHLLKFGSENIDGFPGVKFYLKEDQLIPSSE